MNNKIDVKDLLQAGIKAQGQKQNTIASNVANLDTPGYRRVDVKFEDMLAQALDSDKSFDAGEISPEIYKPMNTPVNANGNDVNLDVEVGDMVKNTLLHKTYTLLLKKKYNQVRAAINTKA